MTWKPVPEDSNYEVSDQGEVRSISRDVPSRWGSTRRLQGRILRGAEGAGGYLAVCLGRGKRRNVHVLVLEAFEGPRPPGAVARHLNGDCKDNRRENLSWGSASQNRMDIVRHGRDPRASKTRCKNGHEFTPENTYRHSTTGCRECRECRRQYRRARRASGVPHNSA